MKFYSFFVSAVLLLMPGILLAEGDKMSLQEKIKHIAVGVGKGSLAFGQVASATLLTCFIKTRIEEVQITRPDHEKFCAALALVGIITISTLVYDALRLARSSYQSFKRAHIALIDSQTKPSQMN